MWYPEKYTNIYLKDKQKKTKISFVGYIIGLNVEIEINLLGF